MELQLNEQSSYVSEDNTARIITQSDRKHPFYRKRYTMNSFIEP